MYANNYQKKKMKKFLGKLIKPKSSDNNNINSYGSNLSSSDNLASQHLPSNNANFYSQNERMNYDNIQTSNQLGNNFFLISFGILKEMLSI